MTERSRVGWVAVVAVVLVGALIRWYYLAEMSRLLLYDEAFLGIDAFSLIHNPRLVPFFPDNLGAESLWVYLLVPPLAVFGAEPFPIRLAATTTGILSVVAVYAFANQILGRRGALWSALGFAVLYWHVHLSYLAFRSILIPLIGALAFTMLLRAFQHNRHWFAVGLLFGLLGYIYFPGTLWIGMGVLMQVWWFWHYKDKRRGIALSLLLTGLLLIPITFYLLTSPHFALKRPSMTVIPDLSMILPNIVAWIGAWFGQWGVQPLMNLPGRPLLDFPLGVLFIAGLIGLRWTVKKRWMAGWLVALGLLTLLPSIVSLGSPHTGRAFGLTVLVAVVFGSGALVIERVVGYVFAITLHRYRIEVPTPNSSPLFKEGLQKGRFLPLFTQWRGGRGVRTSQDTVGAFDYAGGSKTFPYKSVDFRQWTGILLLVVLFAWAGLNTLRDFNAAIASLSALLGMEQKVMSAMDEAEAILHSNAPVYFLSLPYCYPLIEFQAQQLGLRHHGVFLPEQRVIIPDVPLVYYVSFGSDVDMLLDWVQFQEVIAQPQDYSYIQATPRREVVSGWRGAPDDGNIAFRLLDVPESVSAGETLTLALALRPLQARAIGYSINLSLPELLLSSERKSLLGETEDYLCDGAAPPQWQRDEIVIQRFTLPIPESAPPGNYPIVINARYGDDALIEIIMPQKITISAR